MSMGFRIFFVNDDDEIRRIPLRRFERCLFQKAERFREYAGQRIRYALVTVELEERQPIAITRIDSGFIKFDKHGRRDEAEGMKAGRLAVQMVADPFDKNPDGSVVDATAVFAKKRYEHEFRWRPSAKVKRAIEDAVLKRKN